MAAVGRLVVILAADVVGYSHLIEAGEESTLKRLEARRQQLVYSKVEEHNGRIVRATGGSLLVEFASPTEAVRCAVEVQRGMIDRNIGAAADRHIAFRIGINIGDVTPTGGDLVSRAVAALPTDRLMTLVKPGTEIYGNSSRIAERIAAFAQPGGICISGAVWDAIRDQLPSAFEDLGKQNLDIGAGPVHCFAMRADSVAAGQRIAAQDAVSAPVSGMSSPAPRTALQKVLLTAGLVFTIAIWIGSGLVFLDSFRHEPSTPTASVTDNPAAMPQPAASAWPEVAATDNALQPPEAQSPPKSRSSPSSPAVGPPLVSAATTPSGSDDDEEVADPGARELIMKGWALYRLPYTLARWQEARRDFERALELDSRSSGARIGLAAILSTKLADSWSPVLQEDIPQAEQLLREALETSSVSNQAVAHFTLGILRQMQTRLPEAQKEFEIALSLDSDNARGYFHRGETLLYLGQPAAAIPSLEKAIQLDPNAPNAAFAHWALGACQLLLGRVDQAIDLLRTALDADARVWAPYFYLAGALGLQGDLEKARSALAESIGLRPAIRSLARMRAENSWLINPQYWALQEKTLNVGLRQAGLPDQ
jgi:tetratricopeptide (TPR) repeat protein/class 3 adenylate cyclase